MKPGQNNPRNDPARQPSPAEVDALIALYNERRYAEAESRIRALLGHYPDFAFGWKLLGGTLRMLGKDALPAFQKVTELMPDDAEAHFNLGVVRKSLGRLDQAVTSYQRAIQLKPDYAEAHSNLGNTLKDLGRLDDAVASYRRAIKIKPDSADAHNNLGTALKDMGQFDEAIASYRKAVALKPDFALAYYNLGNVQKELGQVDAVVSYRKAIEIKPDFADAHNNLGTALKDLGQYDAALASYRRVLELRPGAEAYNNLGVILKDLGKLDDAITSYRKAVDLKPDYAEAHNNLGVVLQTLGQFDAALNSFRRAVEIAPDFAEAHSNMGNALKELGQLDGAVASCRRALEIKPDYAAAYNNLGIALKELGQFNAARESYRRALQIKPDYAEAHNNLGSILKELGQFEEAVASYRKAVELKPDYAEAHSNLGIVLQDVGQFEEAATSYRRALELKPDYAEAYSNLGNALQELGQFDAAVASHHRALEINPAFAMAHNNLGNALQALRQFDAAVASYRHALEIKPDYAEAHSNLGNVLKDIGLYEEALACYRRALELKPDYDVVRSKLLFTLNYIAHTSSYGLAEAREYGRTVSKKVTVRFSAWQCADQSERLRVGLVSGDFRKHSVGHFLAALLARIDPARIELIAYPTQHKEDELTARIRPHFSAWKPLIGKSDEAAARLIHADGVHILFDLSGHTAHNRLPVFAWKPAPVQVTWLGLPVTTGVAEMDYVLGDSHAIPTEHENHFSEAVWRMPESCLCLTVPSSPVDVAPLPALAAGYVTFGSFNNLTKMTDAVVAVWARVLKSVPNSRLLLKAKQLKQPAICEQTRLRFASCGISPDRLLLGGTLVSAADHLAAYNKVDIALDTFPYPGVTTSVEALWMGVPVLSLRGDRFLSCTAGSIAHNAGLPDWIASDEDDYVAKAVAYSGDIVRLAGLRAGLRHQVLASPLFDAPRFAKNFEDALWGMWQAHIQHNTNVPPELQNIQHN